MKQAGAFGFGVVVATQNPMDLDYRALGNAGLCASAPESSISAKLRFMSSLEELLAAIRRLPLAERLRIIERASIEAAEDTPQPAGVGRPLSVDEFLAARLTPPASVP